MLTLDQDTEVDPNMVGSLCMILSQCHVKESIGIIGSNSRSKHSGRLYIDCTGQADEFIETKTVVTSGSLMSVSAYEKVGPFREDFFIEGVDLEYCRKLRAARVQGLDVPRTSYDSCSRKNGGDATLLLHKGYEMEHGSDWAETPGQAMKNRLSRTC